MIKPEIMHFFDDCLIQSAWSYRESELFLITDGDLIIKITPTITYSFTNILSFEIIEHSEFEEIKRQAAIKGGDG